MTHRINPPKREAASRHACAGLLAAAAVLVSSGLMIASARADGATEPHMDSTVVHYQSNGGREFEQPLGVAIDVRANEIVVANTGLGRVEFFGADGRPHGYFVHRIEGADGAERDGLPKHVAIDARSHVLVSDAWAAYVDVCDFRGQSLAHITLPAPDDHLTDGSGPGPIAVAPDGRIFVATRGKQGRVHVFDAEGKWLATWGTPGSDEKQLAAISALAVTPDGNVVVTCISTRLAVQIFDAAGRYLRGFGIHDVGPGRFSQPTGVVVTPDGRIWVSDGVRHNVQVFDTTGNLLGVLGGGEGPGDFFYPSALASDGKGMFALVETGGKRLRVMWVR